MRYLNKIIFINSARIQYAEIQIDGNVHFIGTQGVGKSTALRALLFFYNADKTKLGISKEKKSFDTIFRTSIHTLFMKWWWMMLRIAYWLSVRREGSASAFWARAIRKNISFHPREKHTKSGIRYVMRLAVLSIRAVV